MSEHVDIDYEIDQEPDCPQCGYRCIGFVDGEACSSSCHLCGAVPAKDKNRKNSGYWAQIFRPPAAKCWICNECYNSDKTTNFYTYRNATPEETAKALGVTGIARGDNFVLLTKI